MADATQPPAPTDVGMDPHPEVDDDHPQDSPSHTPNLPDPDPDANLALYHVSEASQRARERKEHLVHQLLMNRRALTMVVPTNDTAVQERLCHLGHPVSLPGEREMERRDRLRAIMAQLDADGELDEVIRAQEVVPDDVVAPLQVFCTEGSSELLLCRKEILRFSLSRSQARMERGKQKRTESDEDEDAETEQVLQSMANASLDCSEIGDGWPLSSCAFSPDVSLLATG